MKKIKQYLGVIRAALPITEIFQSIYLAIIEKIYKESELI